MRAREEAPERFVRYEAFSLEVFLPKLVTV